MAKKSKGYIVRWELDVCEYRKGGRIHVPIEDVAGMSHYDRQAYFQQLVDHEVAINGPCGIVTSVEEQ